MIVGHGDIASILDDRDDVTYFVSGVSNSRCTDVNEFERERMLLLKHIGANHLVYISTLAIYYGDSMYVQHKKAMENIIRNSFPAYTIIRIGNITWGRNPNTILNYFRNNPDATAQPVYRYLVDLEEFKHWVGLAKIGDRTEMNITGRLVWVPHLLASIRAEKHNGKIYAHGPKV